MTALSAKAFESVTKLFHNVSGIKLGENKHALVSGRLQKLAQEAGEANLDAYVERLVGGNAPAAEMTRVIDRLTTNENLLLPRAAALQRPGRTPARPCSAGRQGICGVERRQLVGRRGLQHRDADDRCAGQQNAPWQIIGTDLSTSVLDSARKGPVPDGPCPHGAAGLPQTLLSQGPGRAGWPAAGGQAGARACALHAGQPDAAAAATADVRCHLPAQRADLLRQRCQGPDRAPRDQATQTRRRALHRACRVAVGPGPAAQNLLPPQSMATAEKLTLSERMVLARERTAEARAHRPSAPVTATRHPAPARPGCRCKPTGGCSDTAGSAGRACSDTASPAGRDWRGQPPDQNTPAHRTAATVATAAHRGRYPANRASS